MMLDILQCEINHLKQLMPDLEALPLFEALKPEQAHAQFQDWLHAIQSLKLDAHEVFFENGILKAQGETEQEALLACLKALKPWRKGHFDLFGIDVDSEWRSDLKYQRLRQIIDPQGLNILDVGGGNGYYAFRLLLDGARSCCIVEPSWHYFAQYYLLKQCLKISGSAFLPTTLDDTPLAPVFDLSLSMGVFYHRRDPLGHLLQLKNTIKNKGLLLLETLVIEGDEEALLFPEDRYAGMKNVYFLPSPALLQRFLRRCGFIIEHVSAPVPTTLAEQRKTEWLDSLSLESFLHPNGYKTIEDLPPPQRCMILARKP